MACPVTTVTTTALVTIMILIVDSDSRYVILHLLTVDWFIGDRHGRQCKRSTQRREHQGKGDKNQD